MAVYKRYKGERISSKHPAYAKARWWVYKRIKGHPIIHQGVPEAQTREEAEIAERQIVKQMFDKAYGLTDTTTTFDHQLKHPDSRLRHLNPRYRKYAQLLEKSMTKEEVIAAASEIRSENARIGLGWEKLPASEKTKTTPPLTSKEFAAPIYGSFSEPL